MEYALLDVTSNDEMPQVPEELHHTIAGVTMQGGKVFVAEDKEAGELRGVLGVFPSHIEGVIEICMMHTLGQNSEGVISEAFIQFVLENCGAKVCRCQLMDDVSRALVKGLGFTHESTIFAIDLGEPREQASEGIISIAGKGFAYLNIEQRNQLRHLIRLGAEEESTFTGETYSMPDSNIDGIFLDISEAKYDVYVRLDGEEGKVIGMLMIDPQQPQFATIGSVAVHPEHRLKNIGRDLVSQAVADYGGDNRLVLATVLEKTPHLKEFFTNCGMDQTATIHKFALSEEKEEA